MFRLLFWIALIMAAVWLWRRIKQPARSAPAAHERTEPMVRCAHCAVHLPQSSALNQAGQWYCSQAHLEQGPRQSGQ